MSLSNSTIFKRHESRHSQSSQLASISISINTDTSFGETLANMTSRSSIYRMHEQRQKAIVPEVARSPMTASSSYTNGLSFTGMANKSTIFQRNARRASR